MNIPPEFADYLTSRPGLSPDEQEERHIATRVDEIIYRAKLMASLDFDKEVAGHRIKKNFEWAFELGEFPSFCKSIEPIIDDIYSKLKK